MKLFILNETNNKTVNMLRLKFIIEVLDKSNMNMALSSHDTYGLIIDCKDANCKSPEVKALSTLFLNHNKSLILLNINAELMAYLVGISVNCENAVVQKYIGNQLIVECLDNQNEIRTTGGQVREVDREQNIDTIRDMSRAIMPESFVDNTDTPMLYAAKITSIVTKPVSTDLTMRQNFSISSDDSQLPSGIFKTFYIKLSKTGLVDPELSQVFSNELVFVVELIASYQNPPYKYLQITTLGAGLNPTSGKGMQYDASHSKGYWQDTVEIKMYPMNGILTLLESEPKNVNKQSSYEVQNTIKLDVDISKNPAFKPNYTLSNKYTTSVYDFEIINRTIPAVAQWTWQMDITKNSIEDVFITHILDRPTIKELPVLATENLQPYCSSTWYVDNSFNGTVPVRLTAFVNYYRAYSIGFGLAYYANWIFNTSTNQTTFYVDFSEVNP